MDDKSLFDGLTAYFRYYNKERKHSKLDKQIPVQVYFNWTLKMMIFVTVASFLLQSFGLSLREQQERSDGYNLRGFCPELSNNNNNNQ